MDKLTRDIKEIYFGRDVIREVSGVTGVSEILVKRAFYSYLEFFRKTIETTDELIYSMPFLGNFVITEGKINAMLNTLKMREKRAKTSSERESIRNVIRNYKIRAKKMKVEITKLNKKLANSDYFNKMKARRLKNIYTRYKNHKGKRLRKNLSYEAALNFQNKYAYTFYEKKDMPVAYHIDFETNKIKEHPYTTPLLGKVKRRKRGKRTREKVRSYRDYSYEIVYTDGIERG